MKKLQHTPGPWQADMEAEVRSASGKYIACVGDPAFPGRMDDRVNAVLIAAAPDLLAAGMELLAMIDAVGIDPRLGDETDRVFPRYEFEALRAAVARATATCRDSRRCRG